jgi:D-inositol-3-phosphate glycosyltransferase
VQVNRSPNAERAVECCPPPPPSSSLPSARIAMLSVHTSPLDQPGAGDAGGMNVYIGGLARALADAGASVDIFTRRTRGRPAIEQVGERVLVRQVTAGPDDLTKDDLPRHLDAFAAGVLGELRCAPPYDLVHSHYWLSGIVGSQLAEAWSAPLVHTMHTLAKVKNAALAPGEAPEAVSRVTGEERVVGAAHALVASTAQEASDLVRLYGAEPSIVHVVEPGVDHRVFHPGAEPSGAARRAARTALGLDPAEPLVLFAGRLQPLKAPDVLVEALAELRRAGRGVPRLVVLGGPSGDPGAAAQLAAQAARHGIGDRVEVRPPVAGAVLAQWYRAADVVAVPSRSESFGLVAAEAQACGTPVVAACVGGLRTVVADGVSGQLVPGHDPVRWAAALADLLADPDARERLAVGAARHGASRGWDSAAAAMLKVYVLAGQRRRAGRSAA